MSFRTFLPGRRRRAQRGPAGPTALPSEQPPRIDPSAGDGGGAVAFRPEHLPRVAPWAGGGDGADAIRSFIAHEVGASAAVALTTLFWPRFVEVDGAVLIEGAFTREGLRAWQTTLGSDVRAIESVVNHLHLWDAFGRRDDPVPDEALLYLAGVLAQTWRAALRTQFPDRAFEVTVESGPEEYGPTLYAASARPHEPAAAP